MVAGTGFVVCVVLAGESHYCAEKYHHPNNIWSAVVHCGTQWYMMNVVGEVAKLCIATDGLQ